MEKEHVYLFAKLFAEGKPAGVPLQSGMWMKEGEAESVKFMRYTDFLGLMSRLYYKARFPLLDEARLKKLPPVMRMSKLGGIFRELGIRTERRPEGWVVILGDEDLARGKEVLVREASIITGALAG